MRKNLTIFVLILSSFTSSANETPVKETPPLTVLAQGESDRRGMSAETREQEAIAAALRSAVFTAIERVGLFTVIPQTRFGDADFYDLKIRPSLGLFLRNMTVVGKQVDGSEVIVQLSVDIEIDKLKKVIQASVTQDRSVVAQTVAPAVHAQRALILIGYEKKTADGKSENFWWWSAHKEKKMAPTTLSLFFESQLMARFEKFGVGFVRGAEVELMDMMPLSLRSAEPQESEVAQLAALFDVQYVFFGKATVPETVGTLSELKINLFSTKENRTIVSSSMQKVLPMPVTPAPAAASSNGDRNAELHQLFNDALIGPTCDDLLLKLAQSVGSPGASLDPLQESLLQASSGQAAPVVRVLLQIDDLRSSEQYSRLMQLFTEVPAHVYNYSEYEIDSAKTVFLLELSTNLDQFISYLQSWRAHGLELAPQRHPAGEDRDVPLISLRWASK